MILNLSMQKKIKRDAVHFLNFIVWRLVSSFQLCIHITSKNKPKQKNLEYTSFNFPRYKIRKLTITGIEKKFFNFNKIMENLSIIIFLATKPNINLSV